ncbi:S-layer homology domain-containing protein [Candidatus Gracilibacteria bacterium]|nr:S-layer homology domain-containing protein [Candidatus Gracilibacteria bacterium]
MILFLGLVWGVSVQAFFVDPALELEEKKVHIDVSDDGIMQIDIYEKITSNSGQDRDIIVTHPLPSVASNIQFFVESEGQELDILEGQERLETLFSLAAEFQEPVFFRMGTESFPTLFRSQEISIPAQSSKYFKLSFQASPDFINDFFFSEIFLNDNQEIGEFELILNLQTEEELKHFLSNIPKNALVERTTEQVTLLWTEKNFTFAENFKFFWSEVENPIMQFPYQGHLYEGYFVTPPVPKGIGKVAILVDKSGSLFGAPWIRIQEWLHFLLDEIGEDTEVRIGFLGEDLQWYEKEEGEGYNTNSFTFRKDFFTFFDQIKPVGKVDLSSRLESLEIGELDKEQVVLLITDQNQDVDFVWKDLPLVLLSFTGDSFSDLAIQARWSGGFFQKLFKNADGLIEKEEFLKKWRNQLPSFRYPEEGKEIQPLEFREASGKDESFFISRQTINPNVSYAKALSFLPRLWGQRRLAEIFSNIGDVNEQSLDAILAIGRTFGIRTGLFAENTTRSQLQRSLISTTPYFIKSLILGLEDLFLFFSQQDMRFYGATPLYLGEKGVWRSFDFYDRVNPETLLEIAPFSEAQKDLFLRFPDILAIGFGIGTDVDFCTEFRCLSLRKKYRKESLPTDRILFKHYDPYHWANEYLILAMKKGLFTPGEQGELQPEAGVNRAELARLIYLLQQKKSH